MFRKKRLNNKGNTMVMALVAIAFVALLVVAVLSASLVNINLKRMNSRSKNTFYTAESVLDEIRAGVGHDAVTSMSTAYEKVLTTMVRQGESYKYVINNDQANKEFKEIFIEDMLKKVSNDALSFENNNIVSTDDSAVLGDAVSYLDDFIEGYDDTGKTAKVKSISKITAVKEEGGLRYTIVLQDVVIDYKEDKADEDYFSNITVDLDITFPNLTVDFAGGNSLLSFQEYSLITDRDIMISGKTLNVNSAHIYAGNDIWVTAADTSDGAGGALNVTGNAVSIDGAVQNANIVAGKDIVIKGSSFHKSQMTVNGGDIWCTNLTTDSCLGTGDVDISIGSELSIDSFSNTYIKDDLNLFGSESDVTIGGNLYAYSHDGSSNTNHATSSAIIITGDNSQLRLNLNKLIVGGRSYIIIPGETYNYMTGESISVRADQELYLIPSQFIYGTPGNPMAKSAWEHLVAEQEDPAINETGTPLVSITGSLTEGLLDSTNPYVVKVSGNVAYLYYNFNNKASATEYVKRIINGGDAVLRANLNSYFTSVVSGVSVTAGSMYTAGVLMQSSGNAVTNTGSLQTGGVGSVTYANSNGTIPTDVFHLSSMNYKNRFDILTHLLADIPATKNGTEYIVNDTTAALTEFYSNYAITGSEMTNSASANIVDYSLIESHQYNTEENLVMYDSGIIKLAIDEATYVVPSEVTGGIIISTGVVKLDHDFRGLIICKENIIITDNATVTTDVTMIENLIRNEYLFDDGETDPENKQVEEEPFKNYFYAYKDLAGDDDSSEPVKIENISYKDIVGANNWRKYDDGN